MRWTRRAAVWAVAVALAGCARSVFPPGGPIDRIPPRAVATTPADSAVGVSRDVRIEILFSEGMDHASVRDGFRIYPPAGLPRFDWSGKTFRVEWQAPLEESTTYVAVVSGSARDARGVPMGSPIRILFSTGPEIARGRIYGVLRAKTLPYRTVPILAFADSLGPRPDTTGALPSYATETDTSGAWELTGIRPNRAFTIHAFFDRNTNGAIDPETDLVVSYGEAIRLTPERAVADSVNITAVDPLAPAIIAGTITAADTTARFRIEARDLVDSPAVKRVERNGPGGFVVRAPAGRYRLLALRFAAGATQPSEEISRTAPLEVKPEEEYGPFDFNFGSVGVPEPAPAEADSLRGAPPDSVPGEPPTPGRGEE